MRRYTTSFVAQKKAIISTIHNNANFGGGGGGGAGAHYLKHYLKHFREGENAQRTLQQAGAVEPSKQGIIYNHQASTAPHCTGKQASLTKGRS
jgi:hypothetical protein